MHICGDGCVDIMREGIAPLAATRACGSRFCYVCREFLPAEQFDKGRGDVCVKHERVSDSNAGMRFCRVCATVLPLERFPAGQKRFICRSCAWLRTGKKTKAQYRAKRGHIQRLWSMCYADRAAFKQARVGLSQTDIACLLAEGKHSALDADGLAVVPRDPCAPLAVDNAVLVTRARRRVLLGLLASGGHEAYACELSVHDVGATRALCPKEHSIKENTAATQ